MHAGEVRGQVRSRSFRRTRKQAATRGWNVPAGTTNLRQGKASQTTDKKSEVFLQEHCGKLGDFGMTRDGDVQDPAFISHFLVEMTSEPLAAAMGRRNLDAYGPLVIDLVPISKARAREFGIGTSSDQVKFGRLVRAWSCCEVPMRSVRRPAGATRAAAVRSMDSKRSTARRVTTS